MDDEEDEAQRLSLEVTIPLDAHLCARRACPHCGLEFKQAVADVDLSGILTSAVGRLHKQGGGSRPRPPTKNWCPYCGHEADGESFFHDDHVAYLERLIHREFVEQMVRSVFSPLEELRSTKHVKVTVERGPRSARPMLGPEPTDMVRIRCLQCGELFKVMAEWRGPLRCPDCATELVGT